MYLSLLLLVLLLLLLLFYSNCLEGLHIQRSLPWFMREPVARAIVHSCWFICCPLCILPERNLARVAPAAASFVSLATVPTWDSKRAPFPPQSRAADAAPCPAHVTRRNGLSSPARSVFPSQGSMSAVWPHPVSLRGCLSLQCRLLFSEREKRRK